MKLWKDKLAVGAHVCLTNYKNEQGIRFGTIEDISHFNGGTFLVKMQKDEKENPVHYKKGEYRRYKIGDVKENDIQVI